MYITVKISFNKNVLLPFIVAFNNGAENRAWMLDPIVQMTKQILMCKQTANNETF